jgi:uracil-DNA glycosylase
MDLEQLAVEVRGCRACADLPLGPRPVLRVSPTARLLIAGQAPGTRVHETGIPWNDASGRRLRQWLALSDSEFYDASQVAILPMGFCYPGRLPNGGDRAPRRECAPLWRDRLIALMPQIRLTLLVGSYAIDHALGPGQMTARVQNFRTYLPRYLPLPHPSWRTTGWEKRNPWFVTELLPVVRSEIRRLMETAYSISCSSASISASLKPK